MTSVEIHSQSSDVLLVGAQVLGFQVPSIADLQRHLGSIAQNL